MSNENSANRNDGFQILADGTQDLAALVGLFATDGVERYTIDYTRGFLPPVTAPISLFGLLGYVRSLLKLSLGTEFCERTGFSTTSLRSYAGVRRRDVPQSERIIEVHYLERTISDLSVEWNVVKTIPHTQESMPLIAGGGKRALRDRRAYDPSFSIAMCSLVRSGSTARLAFGMCGLCLMLTSSLSSLMVLMFPAPWTWARFFACVGLPVSVLIGGLPWCWVYITEHLPFESCDWFRSDWKDGTALVARSADVSGQSLIRKSSFAYFARDDHFYIFDCRAVSVSGLRVIKATSFCAAVCITIAYICQYIELKSASARQSGIWLSIQGILAIVRVLAWDWAPRALGFSTEADVRWTDQRDKFFKDSLTELEITLCWSSVPNAAPDESWETKATPRVDSSNPTQCPPLPKWLVGKIDSVRLVEAFSLWNRLRVGVAIASDFHQLQDASAHWDMPDYIFARWLQLRCRAYGPNVSYVASKRRMGVGAWMCRIMQDMDGRLHMIPGISLHVYSEDRKVTPSDEIIFFSHCRNPELNIICFPRSHASERQRLYHGADELPNDYRAMPWLFKRTLEPFYQNVVDKLWEEMVSALRVLGFAGT
ncbi:MAG: hypothetical protein ASARMPRED_001727 [Alectoria sarmentosa]|nr:MAG: hypothetical protein ASARMPRED_001727 [Alectoria sarmentosa]